MWDGGGGEDCDAQDPGTDLDPGAGRSGWAREHESAVGRHLSACCQG